MNRQKKRELFQTLLELVHPAQSAVAQLAEVEGTAPIPLVRLAAQHRVSPYLANRYPGETSLRAVLLADRAQERTQRRLDLQVLHRLREVTEPIVLKGLVSKHLLTPNLPRRSGDLDVLIDEDHIGGVERELLALGYHQSEEFMSVAEYRQHHHHDAPWVLEGAERHTVEVHRHPLRNPIGSVVPVERFFAGVVEMSFDGEMVTRLSDVDFAFNLIVHAFEGRPTELRALAETALAVQRLSEQDVDELVAAGAHPEVARAMAWSLSLVELNLPGVVPNDLLDPLFGRAGISTSHRMIGERALGWCGTDLDLWYGARLALDPLLSASSSLSGVTGAARVMATEVRTARRSAGKVM